MKLKNYFRYLLTAVFVFAVSSAWGDQVTYTFTNVNQQVSVTRELSQGSTILNNVGISSHNLLKTSNSYCKVDASNDAGIVFSNFLYHVNKVSVVVPTITEVGGKKNDKYTNSSITIYSYDENGNVVSNGTWSKSQPQGETVTFENLKGLKKIQCTTGNASGKKGYWELRVYQVIIDYDQPTISAAKTLEFLKNGNSVNVSNGYITNQSAFTLRYSSSDASVLSVDQKGKVIANKCGSAVITVSMVDSSEQSVGSTTFTTQVFDINIRESVSSILKNNFVTISKGNQWWGGNYWIENEQNSFTYVYRVSDISGSNVLELSGSTVTGKNIGYGKIEVIVKNNGVEVGSASLSLDGRTAVYQLEGTDSYYPQDQNSKEQPSYKYKNDLIYTDGFSFASANIMGDNLPNGSSDWEILGTLSSNSSTPTNGNLSKCYNVGLKSKTISAEVPAYTSLAYQFSTTCKGSQNYHLYGSEIICVTPSDATTNYKIQTNNDYTTDSISADSTIIIKSAAKVCRLSSETQGDYQTKKKASSSIKLLYNNESTTQTKEFRVDMMAWTGYDENEGVTAAFWYNTKPDTTYYATVSFYASDETTLLGKQEFSSKGRLNAYNGSGKILGWKIKGTDLIAFADGSIFDPCKSKVEGGYGPISLVAVMNDESPSGSGSGTSSSKIGNTVSVRGNNGSLSSDGSYWIHNQVPLQVIANDDSAVDSETGLPTVTKTNGFTNNSSTNVISASSSYVSVVMPRGYRILGYTLRCNSLGTNGIVKRFIGSIPSDGNTNAQYGYAALNTGVSESFASNEHAHAIYFNVTNGPVSLDSLVISYTVDDVEDSYVANLPNTMGSSMTSDIMDLTSSSPKVSTQNIVKVYNTNNAPTEGSTTGLGSDVSIYHTNTLYTASANGNYIVEAPKGYRIVGANAYFTDYNIVVNSGIQASDASSSSDYAGQTWKMLFDNDESTKWCGLFYDKKDNYYVVFSMNNPRKITSYTLVDGADTYTDNGGGAYYWRHWDSWVIYGANFSELPSDPSNINAKVGSETWHVVDSVYNQAYTMTEMNSRSNFTIKKANQGAYKYYMLKVLSVGYKTDGDNSQNAQDSQSQGGGDDPGHKQQMAEIEFNYGDLTENDLKNSDLSYTVLTASGSSTTPENAIGTDDSRFKSYTVFKSQDGSNILNNDAIMFNISNLGSGLKAFFHVNLDLLPLDPHVQSIKITATKATTSGNGYSCSAIPSVDDYKFNDGEPVIVTVPGSKSVTDTFILSLSNASNENDYATTDGNSNFYLLKSPYDNRGAGKRDTTSQVGTANASFITINNNKVSDVSFSPSYTDLARTTIGYSTGSGNTYYLYSADKPLYCLTTNDHTAYRSYKLTVMIQKSDVDPVIKITKIHDKTDDSNADTNHKYVGVTVGAKSSIKNLVSAGYYYICQEDTTVTPHTICYMKVPETVDQTISGVNDITDENVAIWYVEKFDNGIIRISTEKDGLKYYVSRRNDAALELSDKEDATKIDWYIDSNGKVIYGSTILNFTGGANGSWQACNGGYEQFKPLEAVSYSNGIQGYMASEDIVSAINLKLRSYNDTPTNGILYVDMSGVANVTETTGGGDWSTFQNSVSSNALFFLPYNSSGSFTKNVVCKNKAGDCFVADAGDTLLITDKKPFFSPYEFTAANAKYTHASSDKWRAMCLPFDVPNDPDKTGITYYRLVATSNNSMVFRAYDKSSTPVILANTSVISCYDNDTLTYNCQNVSIAQDDTLKVEFVSNVESVGTYNSNTKEITTGNAPWQFISSRFYKYIYGRSANDNYTTIPDEAEINDDVYWLSSNKMYRIDPTNRVRITPMHPYFKYNDNGSSNAKAMNIIILDDDDFANDITDIINGNETVDGDGKIYDLQGRRVKMPVSGKIYIVNGKKKLF